MLRTVATLVALLAAAPAAQAATATTADGNLRYTAAAGEINNVTFARVSGDTFRATDTGATITAGTGCTQESPNVVTCTTAKGKPIIAQLGDQNDTAISRTSRQVQLFGEDGNDRLVGGSGRDRLDGGTGDDSLSGGTNNDRLAGGPGNDTLSGGQGRDNLQGGDGNDTLDGGTSNDFESGGNGDDTLKEGTRPNGNDVLNGDAGNDTADYSARTAAVNISLNDVADDGERYLPERDNVRSTIDRVLGGAGSDILIGRDGPDDTLVGGPGDDQIFPLRGADHVDGGPGIDQIGLRDLSADDVTCGDGIDSVAADPRDTVASDCEKARFDASMTLRLEGSAAYPTVRIRLICPPTAFKYCAGRVIIRSLGRVRGGRTLTVAARKFSLATGSQNVISVRLRAGARRYIPRTGLTVRATLSAYDGAGPARKDAIRFRLTQD